MRIALGCDHRGVKLKQAIANLLNELGHDYYDFGFYDGKPGDYPDIAQIVAREVASRKFDHGILICSTGIGMSIAANKTKEIRAALCHNIFTARRSRQHNKANILCLGEEAIEFDLSLEIVKTYLSSTFEGGRHTLRVDKIHALEAASPLNSP